MRLLSTTNLFVALLFCGHSAVAANHGVDSSVVGVVAITDWGNIQGSGVIVQPGLIATNCHVVSTSPQSIKIFQGVVELPAKLIYDDDLRDICLLSVRAAEFVSAIRLRSTPIKLNEAVDAIGYPLEGEAKPLLNGGKIVSIVEDGKISSLRSSSPMVRGLSGGGVFDKENRLVGLTDYIFEAPGGIRFILPTAWISTALLEYSRGETHGSQPEELTAEAFRRAVVSLQSDDDDCKDSCKSDSWISKHTNDLSAVVDPQSAGLAAETVLGESMRARIDPNLTLAMMKTLGKPYPSFQQSPNAGPLWIGIPAVNRASKLEGSDFLNISAVLEGFPGNLRAGLGSLREYLNSTDQNPYLGLRAFILYTVGAPSPYVHMYVPKIIAAWQSLESLSRQLP